LKKYFIYILLLSGFSASLFAYDPVTMVQNPLGNRPVFVPAGGSFTVECKTDPDVSDWSVTLSMPYKELSLAVTPGEFANGIRRLSAVVPPNAPSELYDLRVRASDGADDWVRQCVRVISSFKNDFTFIHLPDSHLPSVAWIGFYDDPNTVPEFRQILREINILQPEFVLQTGDLVDNGQDETQFRLAQELLAESEVPFFLTGGNHDLWYDGHSNWTRYFGDVMNFSFQYGSIRFAGMEMYDVPTKTYTAEQMKWLMNVLDASIQAGEKSRVLFTHYDESRQLTGDFVDQYEIDGIFYGHTHVNGEQRLGLRQAMKINTSYTMNDNGEYRLVKVRDGKIAEMPILKFRHLRAVVSPANDGTSSMETMKITNDNPTELPDVLVKLHVRRDAAPFIVTGGRSLQFIDYEPNKRVYYINATVPANGSIEVSVSGGASGGEPPKITYYSPQYDTTISGGQSLRLETQAIGSNLRFAWKKDGIEIQGETGPVFQYRPEAAFRGRTLIEAEVSNSAGRDVHSWAVYVNPSSGNPELTSSARNFFPYDKPVLIQWREPVEGRGIFRYGPVPGLPTGSILEEENANQVRFIPSQIGMGLGVYYCTIQSGGLVSREFSIVIESPQAPRMIGPVGDITALTPVFQWEPVQGVPYYLLIVTDQEIVIIENKETGEYSIDGANLIWSVLTSEHNVPYGSPDPSGTSTSFPAPLAPGGRYWWIVLNCYGSKPEFSSTVQSGVSAFRVALPPSDLNSPVPVSPSQDAELSGPSIMFRWNPVSGASGYKFYPFKIEMEEGVEVVRPIWKTAISTVNTVLEYDAEHLLVKGNYQWKVAAVDKNGAEVSSEIRRFRYDAPAASLNLRTYDDQGTSQTDDDLSLPRVQITYDALSGVNMGLPLSTDKRGERLGLLFSPGTYLLITIKEGYAPARDTISLARDQIVDRSIRLTPDPCSLTGRVLDAGSNPVEAAQVMVRHSLHADITREGTSDQNGNFIISLQPGPWLVSASKPGYQPSSPVSVSVQSGAIETLSSPLVIQKNSNQIMGTVFSASGQPVYGAVVEISGGGPIQSAFTDADGRFAFSVADGSWLFRVSKSGFVSPPDRWLSISGGRTLEVTPSPQLLPSGTLIAGTVSNGLSAISQARILVVPSSGPVISTVSDGFGNFILALPPGYYRLLAEKEGFGADGFMDMSLAAGETVTGVPLLVKASTAAISGLVTLDGFTPLAGVSVFVNGKSVSSDAGGRYEIHVPPGRYRISASREGNLSSSPIELSVVSYQQAENIDFVLSPQATVIRGQVVSSSGGVFGAKVQNLHAETWTDENGYYSLNVDAGTHVLTASKPGFLSKSIQVEAGQAQVLEGNTFPLTRNVAVVRGRTTEFPSGDLLMGVRIEVPEIGVSTVSRQNGEYRLELDPSDAGYTLRVSKEGFETKFLSTGPLGSGSTVTLDFPLAVFSTLLSGKVLDEKGIGVGSAVVETAVSSGKCSAVSKADGSYRLYLPSEGGSFAISVAKTGFVFSEGSLMVSLAPGEKRTLDLRLQSQFVRLKGHVDSDTQDFVALAFLRLKSGGGIAGSVSSDETGYFDFVDSRGVPFLPEGTYDFIAGKPGYRDTLITGVSLSGGSIITMDVRLKKYTDFLEGTVTDGSAPVLEAMIEAKREGSQERFMRLTDDRGHFRIHSIPAGRYQIKLSRIGYTFLGDTTVTAPESGLSFVLVKNQGRFWGKILDRETGQGIGYAGIAAKDGHGNESRTYAAIDGSYDMTKLPTLYPYTLQAFSGGYYSAARDGLPATRGDTTLFQLQRIYGSVSGKVFLKKDSSACPNTLIRVTAESVVFLDTTDQNGRYRITRLPTNQYYVSVEKAGYLASPTFQTVSLWGGGDQTDINFGLEKVSLASLTISGPTSVECGKSGAFSYSAKTADGRQISILPKWSVDLPAAVDSITTGGVLYPRSDFIGPLRLFLVDLYSNIEDSVTVHVEATIRPNDPERRFQDYRGGHFLILAGSVDRPILLGLKFPSIPDARRLMSDYEAIGPIYAFQPSNLILSKSMFLILPFPETAAQTAVMGKWNPSKLKWEIIEGTPVNGGIQAESDQLTQWTVLAPSQPLGIRNLEAKPNPFSPFLQTLKLSFVPTSRNSTVVFITIRIYNMNGDLVRELKTDEGLPKGTRAEISWDGKADSGVLALNGRYLVQIEAKDGSGTEKKLFSVVMVK
jgi:hypothetical protein